MAGGSPPSKIVRLEERENKGNMMSDKVGGMSRPRGAQHDCPLGARIH